MNTQTLSRLTPTVQMLQRLELAPVSAADGMLALTLLRAMDAEPEGGTLCRRIALAGEWVDELLAEPTLPPAFVIELEALRWAVVKVAIVDTMFFTEAQYPIRKMIDALAQRAAFTHLQGRPLEAVRVELHESIGHISLQSQFVLDALTNVRALDVNQVKAFHAQIAIERDERRQGLLHKVRRHVERDIECRTLDIVLPEAARAELMHAFQPLLTRLMLRYGAVGPSSRWARQLLDRFVESFADGSSARERRALRTALCETLRDACLPTRRLQGITAVMDRMDTVRPPARHAGFLPPLQAD